MRMGGIEQPGDIIPAALHVRDPPPLELEDLHRLANVVGRVRHVGTDRSSSRSYLQSRSHQGAIKEPLRSHQGAIKEPSRSQLIRSHRGPCPGSHQQQRAERLHVEEGVGIDLEVIPRVRSKCRQLTEECLRLIRPQLGLGGGLGSGSGLGSVSWRKSAYVSSSRESRVVLSASGYWGLGGGILSQRSMAWRASTPASLASYADRMVARTRPRRRAPPLAPRGTCT